MLKIKKISVGQLALGMYVSELDRPWIGTPFLLQGFQIQSDDDIVVLQDLCSHVFIDLEQSDFTKSGASMTLKTSPAATSKSRSKADQSARRDLRRGRRQTTYEDQASTHEELPAAREAVGRLSDSIRSLFERGQRGEAIDIEEIKHSVEPMVDSICRNPDACIWLARLRDQDNYIYQHSVACSTWANCMWKESSSFMRPSCLLSSC